MDAFQTAAARLGLNEGDQKAALQDYLSTGGVNLDPATTAWCAAFVNATLAQSGGQGTGSNMARSFLEWGQGVQDPQRGDVVVMSRGDPSGPYGHVGFFDGFNSDGTVRVLGGNQGATGAVSVANYDPASVLGYRRSENALAPPQGPQQPAQGPQNALAPVQQPPEWRGGNVDPAAFQRPVNQLAQLKNFRGYYGA